jgi:hypothetical protein
VAEEGGGWTRGPLDGAAGDNHFLYRDIVYAAGRFCAIGGGYPVSGNPNMARTSTSVDGKTWEHWADKGQWLGGVAYGNGYFVTMGGFGRTLRSKDCKTWEQTRASGSAHMRWVGFKDGIFFAGGEGGAWQSSDDGKTWRQGNPPGAAKPDHTRAGTATFGAQISGWTKIRLTSGGKTVEETWPGAPNVIAFAPGRP